LSELKADESNALGLALIENQQLKDQNNELRTQLEFESNQNMNLRAQLHEITLRMEEVSLSCEHYRAAYLEIREQIQNNFQKNKELQHSLSVKEIDFLEVQKNLKFTQEKLEKVAKKNLELKNEIREYKAQVGKINNDYRFTKEKIITLQDNLREKIEEIQQLISHKKMIEKELLQANRLNEVMKIDFENKTNSLESRYNEVLDMYNQSQKEIRDLKIILNGKIEENINFENNLKILSSRLEHLTSEEYRNKQRQEMEKYSTKFKEQRDSIESQQQKIEALIEKSNFFEREKNFYESKHKETIKLLKGKPLEEILRQKDETKDELSQMQSYFAEMQEKFKNVLTEKEQKIRLLESSGASDKEEGGFKDKYYKLEQSSSMLKVFIKIKIYMHKKN
jgi:myosin heavy subunit